MKYEETHPWIRFSLSLPRDYFQLWLKLGEIASKIEHLAGVPLNPAVARELNGIYLAKGVMATTAIEGNTLSEEQVKLLVDGKLNLPPSQHYLQDEVQNILDVCNSEAKLLIDGDHAGLCVELIKSYNRSVLKGLSLEDGVVPGEIRKHSVLVGNVYRGAPAEDCEHLLARLCDWLNGPDFTPPQGEKELVFPFALVKAIVAHLYLAWIHPFGDGNGRTARLVELHILVAQGVPVPASHLLSDHYNRTRTQYYRELAAASRSGGDIIPFISYALQGFLDGIREQIDMVREQQMSVAWVNYVYEKFREFKNSKTHKRRRELVFELTKHNWVAVGDIKLLSAQMALEYAAGERMVQRDINAVSKLGLVERMHGKVRARKEVIQAFLPRRALNRS